MNCFVFQLEERDRRRKEDRERRILEEQLEEERVRRDQELEAQRLREEQRRQREKEVGLRPDVNPSDAAPVSTVFSPLCPGEGREESAGHQRGPGGGREASFAGEAFEVADQEAAEATAAAGGGGRGRGGVSHVRQEQRQHASTAATSGGSSSASSVAATAAPGRLEGHFGSGTHLHDSE